MIKRLSPQQRQYLVGKLKLYCDRDLPLQFTNAKKQGLYVEVYVWHTAFSLDHLADGAFIYGDPETHTMGLHECAGYILSPTGKAVPSLTT